MTRGIEKFFIDLVVHPEDPRELLLRRLELRRLHRHHVLHKVQLAALVIVKHLQKSFHENPSGAYFLPGVTAKCH